MGGASAPLNPSPTLQLTPRYCTAHAQAAAESLTSLSLDDNPGLGDRGAIALADMAATLPHLQALSLTECRIGDEGACALAEALRTTCSLQVLRLEGNPIGADGAAALAGIPISPPPPSSSLPSGRITWRLRL